MEKKPLKFCYFGGEPLGVPVVDVLHTHGFTPALVVCNPDRPRGRGQAFTPPPLKQWATRHQVSVAQPSSWQEHSVLPLLADQTWDVFVVVAYNHILPTWLIELPQHGTLNLHPSLLPKLRGPSPIRTAILENQREAIGVTIMQMDEEMDHGAIIHQSAHAIADNDWPIDGQKLDQKLAASGGALLANCLTDLATGQSLPQIPQNHSAATYTKKFTKEMGALAIDPFNLPRGTEARELLQRIRALAGWPGTYFFYQGKRVKIVEAYLAPDGTLKLGTVVPEGRPATDFSIWRRSLER